MCNLLEKRKEKKSSVSIKIEEFPFLHSSLQSPDDDDDVFTGTRVLSADVGKLSTNQRTSLITRRRFNSDETKQGICTKQCTNTDVNLLNRNHSINRRTKLTSKPVTSCNFSKRPLHRASYSHSREELNDIISHRKTSEMYKVSFPCIHGCAHCAFTKCFGPVKVFFSHFDTPRQPRVREISDGNGRRLIPRARRKEFRGLVYDKETHSLYPPIPRGHDNDLLRVNKTRRVFY